MTLLALLACSDPAADAPAAEPAACDDVADTQVAVVTQMRFGRRVDGVSTGFDLDGHVSDAGDSEGCYQADLVDPSGVPGIDNAFSAFLPVLEATEGAALEPLLQDAIDSGSVLVLFELEDVDDRHTDTCVNLELWNGLGTPRLGTDGVLLSGQTFDIDPSVPPSRADHVAVVDGTVVARGLDLTIPISIFELSFDLALHDVAVSLTLDPQSGAASGYLAGGIEIQQIIDILEPRDDIGIKDLAIEMLRTYADLGQDETGTCHELSVVLEFEAASAYLYDTPPADTGADTSDTGDTSAP